MLLVLNIRLATRLPPGIKLATHHVARPVLAYRPSTRSFWSSTHVEEPVKPQIEKKETDGIEPERKKRASKQPTEAKTKEKKTKPAKVPKEDRPPKGPTTPYLLYFQDYLRDNKTKEGLMVAASKAGPAWHALSDEEKAPYIEQFKVGREKHTQALSEWIKQANPATIRALNNERKLGGRIIRVPKAPGEPKKPPSAFFLYLKDRRAQSGLGDAGVQQFVVVTAQEWRSMTGEEKRPYQERSTEMFNEYKAKKATFLNVG